MAIIPHEIVLEIATQYLDTSNASKLSMCTSELHNHKGYIIDKIVSNDTFLNRYLSNRNLNILSTIKKSSFSESQFFSLYDNIKNAIIDNNTIIEPNKNEEDSFHCLQSTIDSTFEIFKLLMNYAIFNLHFRCRDIISSSVVAYFKKIYFTKFPRHNDFSYDIFKSFTDDRDTNLWYTSNINLYNLYEITNLMYSNKRSFVLKQTIESGKHDGIADVAHNSLETIRLMISLFNYMEYAECRIYILYSIFRYTKTMLKNMPNHDQEMYTYICAVSKKIIEFEDDLEHEHRNQIPRYLRIIMLKDTNELKQMIKEFVGEEN